jgi:putative nucleotidyltransferase with HDIG domain
MEINTSLPLQYLIFVPAISMLAAIIFDSRTAFYVTVTLAFLVAGIRGNDYVTAITMLIGGALAAYTVKDIQNRTQMFQSMFFIFISLSFTIAVFGIERSTDIMNIIKRLIVALVNSALSPLIAYGMLLILEKSVNVASDLRLQEYNNLNHPLLIKMSELAPGTYQHTLSVAMLAERCAGAIYANSMLTKTGSYFHDIGKIAKPEYFVENQSDIQNKHDLMSPRKSAQAIRDHVQAGIEMGRQYHLPERIIDFIPQHHGTTLIKHFYAKAIEEGGAKEINQDDYRYPGPKPQTKEAAILMICDSAEAISRIEGKGKDEIEQIIDANIQDRLLDGQFDECDITIHELQTIKETIVKNMIGVSHKRTSYKEIPKEKV